MAETLTLPGFVNAHSHTFQRGLRGSQEGHDFWGWRDAMLAFAETQTPANVRDTYARTYREMRSAGYTAVGEFHYLGLEEARAAAAAAAEVGMKLVVLLSAYGRGGLPRFRQESVADYLRQVEELRADGIASGLAPHSVRACPRPWLEEISRYGRENDLVLHVHADEQPHEIDECLAEHGLRPIELLADTGCLGPGTTIVHATHANDPELDLLAQAGSRICVCPTTEANLGDGYVPVARIRERGIPLCIGSDCNARIDPLEELRELEGIARRESGRRNVIEPSTLLSIGSGDGAASLGLDEWDPITIDLAHPALSDVAAGGLQGALVMSCSAEVVR